MGPHLFVDLECFFGFPRPLLRPAQGKPSTTTPRSSANTDQDESENFTIDATTCTRYDGWDTKDYFKQRRKCGLTDISGPEKESKGFQCVWFSRLSEREEPARQPRHGTACEGTDLKPLSERPYSGRKAAADSSIQHSEPAAKFSVVTRLEDCMKMQDRMWEFQAIGDGNKRNPKP